MITVERTVFLSILTLIIYVLGIYFQPNGVILFPFPIYPAIFLVVSTVYFLVEKKKDKWSVILLISGILHLLSSFYLWEIFLSHNALEAFIELPIIDLTLLLAKLTLLAWLLFQFSVKQTKALIFFSLLSGGLFLTSVSISDKRIELASFILFLILSFLNTASNAIKAIIGLLAFLSFSEWLTFYLNNF